MVLSGKQRDGLFEQLIAEIFGLSVLEPLLADHNITEIMVNGPRKIYVRVKGKIRPVNIAFRDDNHLSEVIEKICQPFGRKPTNSDPVVFARLKDGSLITIIFDSVALTGKVIVIKRYHQDDVTIEDLIEFGVITSEAVQFIKACVKIGSNILVSGNLGSNKISILNVLSSLISPDERVVSIEDVAQLSLRNPHLVFLEHTPKLDEQRLLSFATTLDADRFIINTTKSSVLFKMMELLNEGKIYSLIAPTFGNSPTDALNRLENKIRLFKPKLSCDVVKTLIFSAFDIVIQVDRREDGLNYITKISEIVKNNEDKYILNDIFRIDWQSGESLDSSNGIKYLGNRSHLYSKMERNGIYIPFLQKSSLALIKNPAWRWKTEQ